MESHRAGGGGGGTCECRPTSNVTSGEREVANTRLDAETPPCSPAGGGGRGLRDRERERTSSYLQVVVEKHAGAGAGAGGDEGTRPPPAAAAARVPHASSPLRPPHRPVEVKASASSPERLEVYRFERVGSALVARGGRAARVEARAARAVRAGRRAGAEVLGAARLAWRLPLGAGLGAARAALEAARDAGAGAAAAASDLALKPALATAYGALVHPLLVFTGQVLAGAREAARPLCAALHDAAGAVARVLAAVRLVEVHVAVACPHHPHLPHPHSEQQSINDRYVN